MTVIVCLDNANGMMFNHRRQSRDTNVVKDILKTINGASLLIAPYSEPLFSQAECSVSISDSFLADADAKDYCFVENTSVAKFKEKISKLVIYKWNRDYPADFYFDIGYPVTLGTDTFGNITRLDNVLEGLPKRLEMNEMELDNLKKQFETAKVDVERPFPQEEELKAKTDRLNELNALLNVDKRENEIVGGEPDEGDEPPEKKPRDLER